MRLKSLYSVVVAALRYCVVDSAAFENGLRTQRLDPIFGIVRMKLPLRDRLLPVVVNRTEPNELRFVEIALGLRTSTHLDIR